MSKYIILPYWFVVFITGVIVDDSEIAPWKTIGGQWVCNYDSYHKFHKQLDSLASTQKGDTLTVVSYPVDSFAK